ncbi:MAG: bifunctional glycosyltransferase family 2/GtrA family protein [Bacilli bacterium]|nr:bifunctional glycosyltransferase family 2/GtrA family protein [Bacilli bacterium]
MEKVALVIPIYEPEENCLCFLKSFKPDDFDYFLIVNDGSSEQYDHIYEEIERQTLFKVVGYRPNKGKGHALKYGFKYLMDLDKDIKYFVTADGDGQHAYDDILHVKNVTMANPQALVLGSRVFDKKAMPRKSWMGNRISSLKFKILTKQTIRDTQTGLRGIPYPLFDLAINTEGNRYDYENYFLEEAVKEAELIQIDIASIYINDNKGSHFRPVRDSLIINKAVVLYALVSLMSWGLDLGLFHLLSNFVFTSSAVSQVYLSTLLARVTSGFFNFLFLFLFVFDKREKFSKKLMKYSVVFVINLGLSATLTYAFKSLPTSLTFVKFVVDMVISIINYFVNRLWVFTSKKMRKKKIIKAV